jgi:hypothetical protein
MMMYSGVLSRNVVVKSIDVVTSANEEKVVLVEGTILEINVGGTSAEEGSTASEPKPTFPKLTNKTSSHGKSGPNTQNACC